METNKIQNEQEKGMSNFQFIGISPLYESVEVFNIIAGSEENAWDLAGESQHNYESVFLLTDKLIKQFKSSLKQV